MTTQANKASAFRALHEGEPFVIPNPWDAGSARVLAALGFEALATTSSGFAYTLGRLDGEATLDEVVAHVAELTRATELPVSVDLENGYGESPESAAEAIVRVAEAGAVGGSIEDYDPATGLYELTEAVERIAAAAEAARGLDFPFVLTARAENHIRGNPDLDDTIARLQAYEAAGADCLYAPGVHTVDEIRALCDSVSRPVNVLAFGGLSFAEIAEAGAQRVSVGGGLTWVAVSAFAEAAQAIRGRRSSPRSTSAFRYASGSLRGSAAAQDRPARDVRGRLVAPRSPGTGRRESGRAPPRTRRAIRLVAPGASSRGARPRAAVREVDRAAGSWSGRSARRWRDVEPGGDTRREATEASGRVVQEHRPAKLRAHRRAPTYQSPTASIAPSSISARSSSSSVSSRSQL